MVAAFGRRRTPIVSLDYLEEFHGWHARAKVLKKFEVAEAALTNPMAPVNAKFFSDVCAYLHQECGLTDSDFLKMGAYSLHGSQRSMLTKILSRQKDPKTLYEVFFTELTKFFERNCIYKVLELTETRCVVDIILHREIGNALKIRNLGNPQSCTVKRGIVSSVTGYLDLPFANVDETRCVHRGDPACRFDISFEEAAHQLKLRDASGGRSRSQERN